MAEQCPNSAAGNPNHLIYLASPYSAPTPEQREQRFLEACRAAAYLMKHGYVVFSPIAHTHPIAINNELPKGWDFWSRQDGELLKRMDMVLVLCLEGWSESVGVQAEIALAQKCGMPCDALVPLAGGGYSFSPLPEARL